MKTGSPLDSTAILSRFDRLIRPLFVNNLQRTAYQLWEVQLLIDIADCQLAGRVPKRTFDGYCKAARQQVEDTGQPPMLLSEYLTRQRRGGRKAPRVTQEHE